MSISELWHHEPAEPGRLVVSFSPRFAGKVNPWFGRRFFDKHRISVVYVRTAMNDWFVGEDHDRNFAEIAEIASGYSDVVGYGASMGAFGFLRSARHIRYTKALLIAPVLSIEPGFEDRWLTDLALLPSVDTESLAPLTGGIDLSGVDITTLSDFDLVLDMAQIELLEQHVGEFTALNVAGSDHVTMQFLRDRGCLGEIIRRAIEGKLDQGGLEDLIETGGKQSVVQHIAEARQLEDRGDLRQARSIYRKLIEPDPDLVTPRTWYAYSGFLSRNRELDAARAALASGCASDPLVGLSHHLADCSSEYTKAGGDFADIEPFLTDFADPTLDRPRQSQLGYVRCLRWGGRLDEAMQALEQFRAPDRFGYHAYYESGTIRLMRGNVKGALEDYIVALHLAPDQIHLTGVIERLKMRVLATS